jgi:hypothetical protein
VVIKFKERNNSMLYICAITESISLNANIIGASYSVFTKDADRRYEFERGINDWYVNRNVPIQDLIRDYKCKIISAPIKNDNGNYCWILESNVDIEKTAIIDEF